MHASCRLSSTAYAAIACFAVEYVGLFTGVSLFLRAHNCLYIILHFVGAVTTGLLYTQVISLSTLSSPVVTCGYPPLSRQYVPSMSGRGGTTSMMAGTLCQIRQGPVLLHRGSYHYPNLLHSCPCLYAAGVVSGRAGGICGSFQWFPRCAGAAHFPVCGTDKLLCVLAVGLRTAMHAREVS